MARQKNRGLNELTDQQLAAIDLLLAGETVDRTAATLGIGRETLSGWREEDTVFIARYNESLQSAWDASQKRLMDAQRKAIDKLAELVDEQDTGIALKAAAALLRITVPRPAGSTNPLGVELGAEWWRRSLMGP
jgi:hypothetical protein